MNDKIRLQITLCNTSLVKNFVNSSVLISDHLKQVTNNSAKQCTSFFHLSMTQIPNERIFSALMIMERETIVNQQWVKIYASMTAPFYPSKNKEKKTILDAMAMAN